MTNTGNITTNGETEKDARKSAEEMDEQRHKTLAYEYLCHLEEAKKWLEACLMEKLPPTTELEENLRNGVYLAKLAHFMTPEELPLNKIYDKDQKRYAIAGLQFRHTDNINHFLRCLKTMQLPLTFQPETTDIYDKKNMPRVIYCIHALSTHLFKFGRAPQIQDLYGKVNFTDEEINAVSKELKKYGIKMPAFQKIGGLLTNNMAGDAAALHAAVIAINKCISDMDQEALLGTLKNSAAQVNDVNPSYVIDYYQTLLNAKDTKMQGALNRSLNDSYVPDAYDELLTQAEIQGHINNVNVRRAWENVIRSIELDSESLIMSLKVSTLKLKNVRHDNAELYKAELMQMDNHFDMEDESTTNSQHRRNLLQKAIDIVNGIADISNRRQEAVQLVNLKLQDSSKQEFHKALKNPNLGLGDYVDEFAIPLYFEEMKVDRAESKNDLSYSDIIVSIRVLSSIAAISKTVDTGNPILVYQSLINPEAHITNLDEENKVKYCRALAACRLKKQTNAEECPLLTYIDIQECIDHINQQCHNDGETIQVLRKLNRAVVENNQLGLVEALKDVSLKLEKPTTPEDASLYLKLFKKCLAENHIDGSELWLEDVENVAQIVMREVEEVEAASFLFSQLNVAIKKNDALFSADCLRALGYKISNAHRGSCIDALIKLQRRKNTDHQCPYFRYVTSGGNESFIDLEKLNYTWDHPKKLTESYFISKEDIDHVIKRITTEEVNARSQKIDESKIIKLQALVRGYLLRKKISDKFSYYHENVDKIIQIQAWWRGRIQRNHYKKFLDERRKQKEHFNKNYGAIRTQYEDILDRYKGQEKKIVKIQALWRGRAARRRFHSLLRLEKPPFPVIRHFSGILSLNADDYDKDLQLQHLRSEVVQTIRHNTNLSQLLDSMDIKIGLLIQNRITLQDIVAHGRNLESLAEDKSAKGLKSLTKEGHKMLQGYQHLFYALQTNPTYLSKLLFLLPESKTNKFLQNVILTLFNFGSNIREEYLLLKLFRSALQEEIRCKFQKPSEVVTGNPVVLKMVVNYARQVNGQRALRQIVGPIIEKILADKTINIETDPVNIYKCWRNQLEMETGEILDLPYSVNPQQALNYEQVRKRLNNGIQLLKTTVVEFLSRITESRDLIPYGMLYMAKVLNCTLAEKFPNAPEKDILKVVGDQIYYHFINPAIVAPDAFDIIKLPIDRSLSNDQRRNLASIAKILQFATSKKGFGEEAMHLVCLNPFIIECHEKFKKFFRYCCQVEELDDHFRIHEYTEATLIHKPEIYISLQEICDTHSLVLEYQYQIAPDPLDTLHELLDDLGTTPSVASLLGITDPICESNKARMGKTEVCLVLMNKFEVPENDDTNLKKLFIKTKELLVSILQLLKGETLVDALESSCSPIQERLYSNKYSSDTRSFNIIKKSPSFNDCKLQLRAYLNKLELGGLVTQADGYQSIVTAIARDLCNKGKYRLFRTKELQTLSAMKQMLEEKSKYYQEQVQYYSEYIQRCLENLHTGKGSLHAVKTMQKNHHGKLKSKMTLKYSAAKLQEKGVLLEIDGLPHSQFKNVIFEISPTDHNGIFTVRGKFMGVEMEKLDVDIQRLLELQFEGAPIMDMFGKAKINVNLLLYLLNRKFYGKT
ncbi:ras GTPase-activating-like protein IQGAP1 [Cephus cinctus]|uniref:Ras GTPase-activating-like protein IQGAP1 n=1 Tax=Cephus cinctus TaxID=211228 RepID=A0AAJ7C1H4_CEPCN|nr:ras GTPase-activating-like protein IQGAP1 [Cephus cinctus]XP_024943019.1 ras GTPase-activating-like protein IQGAP1 [Cephus cinctus]XP_024943020.1 ras GTPase-activating-like protein IQGAP1 [Cephus cinctus]